MEKKINIKFLLELLKINLYSEREDMISAFIKKYLDTKNIKYEEDEIGNIYNISQENAPLLCAHIDTVQPLLDSTKVDTISIHEGIVKGDDIILGGDDKCGIYIILDLLQEYSINFLFCVQEEIGGVGSETFMENNNISHIPYGLVLDREGSSDIICTENNYGVEEFEEALIELGEKFNYKKAIGIGSDADFLSRDISCANLSAGFYESHTNNEYINLMDLNNAMNFVRHILDNLKKNFEAPEKVDIKIIFNEENI
jgi:putative aminopeptidase FrvX